MDYENFASPSSSRPNGSSTAYSQDPDLAWLNLPPPQQFAEPELTPESTGLPDYMFSDALPKPSQPSSSTGYAKCPMCFKSFLQYVIEEHAMECMGVTETPSGSKSNPYVVDQVSVDPDVALAMRMETDDPDFQRRQEARRREEAENERLLQEMLRREEEEQEAKRRAEQSMLSKSACTCMSCFSELSLTSILFLDACAHPICRPCLRRVIMANVESNTPSRIACPTCGGGIGEREVHEIVTTDELDAYHRAALHEVVQNDRSGQLIRCPNARCGSVMERITPDPSTIDEKELGPNGQPLSRDLLVHKNQFRFRCRDCSTEFCSGCNAVPYHIGFTCAQFSTSKTAKHCRFCDVVIPPDAGPTCDRPECGENLARSCTKTLACGHPCHGVAGEAECMPCLDAACPHPTGAQVGDDFCNICWVESLAAAPSIRLKCGHIFHVKCCKQKLERRWPTPAISFGFAACPLCKEPMQHPALEADLAPLGKLQEDIKQRTIVRMQIEGLDKEYESKDSTVKARFPRPEDYGLHVFAYYMCHTCKKPYFGGKKSCVGALDENAKFNAADLVCGSCSGDQADCKRHGKDYIEYKCRFCCALATFFCGGQAHFCTPCHTKAGELVEFSKWTTIKKCEPCAGPEKCPLGVGHAPNGTESALGCAMCRAENLLGMPTAADGKKETDKSPPEGRELRKRPVQQPAQPMLASSGKKPWLNLFKK